MAALAAVVVASLAIAACGGDDDDGNGNGNGSAATSGAETTEQRDISVGYASPVATQPNQIAIDDGMEKAAQAEGWAFQVQDSDLSPDRQVSIVDNFITQKQNGIISWTLDPGALNAAYERAAAADIPLVGLNSESELINTNIVWEVFECPDSGGTEDTAAEYIAERFPEGNVLVIGPPPVPILLSRAECFTKKAKAAGLNVVGRDDNVEDSSASATPIVADLLTAHGDVNAIWSYNDTTALGAAAAVEQSGKSVYSGDNEDGIIVMGSNGDEEAIEAIRSGVLTATFDVNAPESGAAAMLALRGVLNDGEPVSSMPKQITVKSTFIDSENVDDFVPYEERDLNLDNLPVEVEQ